MIPVKNIEDFLALFVKEFDFEYEKVGRKYFLKNHSAKFLKDTNGAIMLGLPLGRENRFFEPSLFLLELLSKKTKNKVFVNSQAEWFFLCGRDIFPENIIRNKSKEKIFLVQNEKDENLGLGMNTKSKGKKIIKNLIDRGNFLRREN